MRFEIDSLYRIRAGDEAALTLLLREEWSGLVRYLQIRLDSADAAQDAAQEAFVRLWEKRESWTSGSARALLYRIGANVAADVWRRKNVRGRPLHDGGAGRVAAPPTPSEVVEGREARARFLAALAELPPKRREVFHLARWERLSYDEIAEVLDLAPQTVANHMSLALRDLRSALADLLPTAKARDTDERSRDG